MLTHTGTQTIHTSRLTLRRFVPDDASAMFENYANDPKVTRFLSWQPHTDVDASRALLTDWCKKYTQDDYYHWAIVFEGKVIGGISAVRLDEVNENAEIGYCIGSAFWNQGIMTEAAHAVITYLFDKVNAHRVVICHALQNPASGRVAQKCGLTFEGIHRQASKTSLGEYLDIAVYATIRKDS